MRSPVDRTVCEYFVVVLRADLGPASPQTIDASVCKMNNGIGLWYCGSVPPFRERSVRQINTASVPLEEKTRVIKYYQPCASDFDVYEPDMARWQAREWNSNPFSWPL